MGVGISRYRYKCDDQKCNQDDTHESNFKSGANIDGMFGMRIIFNADVYEEMFNNVLADLGDLADYFGLKGLWFTLIFADFPEGLPSARGLPMTNGAFS